MNSILKNTKLDEKSVSEAYSSVCEFISEHEVVLKIPG